MIIRVQARGDEVRDIIGRGQLRGEIVHRSQLDTYSTFIVYEVFSFLNSNRMTISIVIFDQDEYTDVHIKSSGGGKGMIFRFDWGAGAGFEDGIRLLFDQANIRYRFLDH